VSRSATVPLVSVTKGGAHEVDSTLQIDRDLSSAQVDALHEKVTRANLLAGVETWIYQRGGVGQPFCF